MGAVQLSSCVSARWRQPKLTNVEIVVYRLYMNDRDVVCEGLVYRCVVEDLKFFTQYRLRVESCTSEGYVKSINGYVSSFESTSGRFSSFGTRDPSSRRENTLETGKTGIR